MQIKNTRPVWFNQPTMTTRPTEVRVHDSTPEGVDRALTQLKKHMEKEGTFQELKDRQYFKSKSRKTYEARQQLLYRIRNKKEKTDRMPRSSRNQGLTK